MTAQTVVDTVATCKPRWLIVTLLAIGFLLAVGLRVVIGGAEVASSALAGLLFAVTLLGLCIAMRLPMLFRWQALVWGVIGTVVLLLVPGLQKLLLPASALPAGSYWLWATVVAFVALAEEAFLRGTFFAVVAAWKGKYAAIVAAAILFALLHIPLYGWHVVPLDFTVGLSLGLLRTASGTWWASGITHTLADLLSWWLV